MQFETIGSPEFINLHKLDINPLMSSCDIKILYLEENRNHSYISKEVATEMAKKLRGAPIVGYYKKDVNDYGDHGERIILEGGEIKTECLTVPYGFVSPDAKVWFQKFEETDDTGKTVIREYLMTTGYLWTEQFEEAKLVTEDGGRPQSMELHEKTLQGNWSNDINPYVDFFIINDAIISKLCILGEDVEPCFEGANIKSSEASVHFTLDDEFKNTLMNMMRDLRYALEGGQERMEDVKNVEETPVVEEVETKVETVDNVEQTETVENEETTEDTTLTTEDTQTPEVAEVATADFVKKDDDEDKEKEDDSKEETSKEEEEKKEEPKEEEDKDDEDKKKKFALLEEKYAELESKFAALEAECESLRAFKATTEDAQKDDLIGSFYMLDEKDIKDIVDNKSQYSLEEIESKLSILYTRKSMSLEKAETEVEEKQSESTDVTTYNLAENVHAVPDWVKAVRETEEQMKY